MRLLERDSLFAMRNFHIEGGDRGNDHEGDAMQFGQSGGLICSDLRKSCHYKFPGNGKDMSKRLTLLAVSPFLTTRSAPTITASMSSCWNRDPTMVSPDPRIESIAVRDPLYKRWTLTNHARRNAESRQFERGQSGSLVVRYHRGKLELSRGVNA